jgi:hypothetical protein
VTTAGARLASGGSSQQTPGIMNDAQFDRMQRQLNRGNPQEITRQSNFLLGVAPAEAESHNIFSRGTLDADLERYRAGSQASIDMEQARMAQLTEAYGMSPWEMMGKSSGAPAMVVPPKEGKGNAADMVTPQLMQSFMSNATSLQAAKIQQQTALQTAGINAAVQKYSVDQQTKAPLAQVDIAKQRLEIDRALADSNITRNEFLNAETDQQIAHISQKMTMGTLETLAKIMPKEVWDTGFFRTESYPGIASAMSGLFNENGEYVSTNWVRLLQAFKNSGEAEQQAFKSDFTREALKYLGPALKVAGAGLSLGFLSNIGNMLGGKRAPRNPPPPRYGTGPISGRADPRSPNRNPVRR